MAGVARLRTLSPQQVLRRIPPRRFDVLVYRSAASACPPSPLPVGLSLDKVGPGGSTGWDEIDRRLRNDAHCYLVTDGEMLIHESWVFRGSMMLHRLGVSLSCPVIGECVTAPGYRGLGLYPFALAEIARDLDSELIPDLSAPAYVLVDQGNGASIRGLDKAGYRLAGQASGVRVAGRLFVSSSTLPRPAG